ARLKKLADGEAQPDPKDKALFQLAAKYHLYQLTWKNVQASKSDNSAAAGLKIEYEKLIAELTSQPRNNKEFLKQFAHEQLVVFKEVLALDMRNYHYAVTNTALMLPVL